MANGKILIDLIEKLGTNVSAFEKSIGVGATRIDKLIKRDSRINLEIVQKVLDSYPSVNKEWLLTGQGSMFLTTTVKNGNDIDFLAKRRESKTETNPELEGVTFVPIAAQANYTQHYADPLFINQLEKVYIPGFPYRGPRYRIFEVAGDSMEPTFKEGFHVVTEYVEPDFWHTIANYYVYVVVTESQIMLKRLFRKSENEYVLISDNEEFYPQFVLPTQKIKELWLVKRKLDWEMSPPKRFEILV